MVVFLVGIGVAFCAAIIGASARIISRKYAQYNNFILVKVIKRAQVAAVVYYIAIIAIPFFIRLVNIGDKEIQKYISIVIVFICAIFAIIETIKCIQANKYKKLIIQEGNSELHHDHEGQSSMQAKS